MTKVQDKQCLVDVALAATGSVEGVLRLAQRNSISPTAVLPLGITIEHGAEDIIDNNVVECYALQAIVPTTY